MDYQSLSSSSRSVPSSCTRWQRTCRGNTKTTGSVTALNRIFYSIARITSITHLTTSYDQLKSQGRNSPTSVILSRVPSTILAIFFFLSVLPLQASISLSSSISWKSLYIEFVEWKIDRLYFLYIETFVRGIDEISMENRGSLKEKSWGRSAAKKE